MPVSKFVPGEWWVVCDQCGLKAHASKMVKRWDGLIVHQEESFGCFETRHPQDFVRAVPDLQKVPFTRPEPTDVETSVTIISAVDDAAYSQVPSGTFGNYDPD